MAKNFSLTEEEIARVLTALGHAAALKIAHGNIGAANAYRALYNKIGQRAMGHLHNPLEMVEA